MHYSGFSQLLLGFKICENFVMWDMWSLVVPLLIIGSGNGVFNTIILWVVNINDLLIKEYRDMGRNIC